MFLESIFACCEKFRESTRGRTCKTRPACWPSRPTCTAESRGTGTMTDAPTINRKNLF
jgi:hypothetical protein